MSLKPLGNRYQVVQILSADSVCTTFLAEDTQVPSRQKFIIKQLKPITNSPQIYQLIQKQFHREAAILEDLGDGNGQISRLYAHFTEGDYFYLIQELIEGVTLREKVETEGVLGEHTVRQILTDILPVLSYIHSKHIIHRDIKPENIILRKPDGKPVLIDFGAMYEMMNTMSNSQEERESSMVVGTAGYMPVEQRMGRPRYSSDLYSLGFTMIYLLTGRLPQELDENLTTGEKTWQRYAPSLSPSLVGLLDKAIQYHFRDRFSSAQEMLAELQKTELTYVPNLNASAENAPFFDSFEELDQAIGNVLDAETTNFFELAEMLGLDPKQDFAGVDLSGADFLRGNLAGANFVGTNLCGANFAYANLQGATLTNADLSISPSSYLARTKKLNVLITNARTLDRTIDLNHALNLARTLALDLASASNLNSDLNSASVSARNLALSLTLAFTLAGRNPISRWGWFGRAIDRTIDRARDHDLDRALVSARDLNSDLNSAFDSAFASAPDLDHTHSVICAIGGGANFYRADLTGAKLDGANVERAIMIGCTGLSSFEIADLRRRGAIFDSSSDDRSEIRVPVPR